MQLYISAQWAIAASYFAIPLVVSVVSRTKKGEGRRLNGVQRFKLRSSYLMFFFLCAAGHICDGIISFEVAYYHAWAVLHAATAAFSWLSLYLTIFYRVEIVSGWL